MAATNATADKLIQCRNSIATEENLINNGSQFGLYEATWDIKDCFHPRYPLDLLTLIMYTTCIGIRLNSSPIKRNSKETTLMHLSCFEEQALLTFVQDEEEKCVDIALDGDFLYYFDCGLLRLGSFLNMYRNTGRSLDISQICLNGRNNYSKLMFRRVDHSAAGIEKHCSCSNASNFLAFWSRIKKCNAERRRNAGINNRLLIALFGLVTAIILSIILMNLLGEIVNRE